MAASKIPHLPLTANPRNLIRLLQTGGYLICGTSREVKDGNMRWLPAMHGSSKSKDSLPMRLVSQRKQIVISSASGLQQQLLLTSALQKIIEGFTLTSCGQEDSWRGASPKEPPSWSGKSDADGLRSPLCSIQPGYERKKNRHIHIQELYTVEGRSTPKVKWNFTCSAGQDT